MASAITNGVVDEADQATVALLTKGGDVYCSGVLVGRFAVATAAHCLSVADPKRVFFGTNPKSRDEGTFIDVAAARAHPAFDSNNLSNDVALVQLAEEAPVKPATLIGDNAMDDSWLGKPVRLVGFGLTSGTADDTGPKQVGQTTIDRIDDGTFVFKGDPSQTCNGDSGGPAFATVHGKKVLIGITSSGDAQCASYGRDTRVDTQLDFIDANAAAYDGLGVKNAGCNASGEAGSGRALLLGVLAIVVRRRRGAPV